MSYRLWVSEEGTVLFRLWDSGKAEVATRGQTWESWGPPTPMVEEAQLAPPRAVRGRDGELEDADL